MEKQAPPKGYILPKWGLKNQYRATAHAYMKREGFENVENHDGNTYSLEEIENSTINFKK